MTQKGMGIKIQVGDFPSVSGATVEGDNYIHFGGLSSRRTACGKPWKDFLLSREVTITCPECISDFKKRTKDPSARRPI